MGIATLLIVFLIVVLVIVPVWVIIRVTGLTRDNEAQQQRLLALEQQLTQLRQELKQAPGAPPHPAALAAGVPPVTAAAPPPSPAVTAPAAPPVPPATPPPPIAPSATPAVMPTAVPEPPMLAAPTSSAVPPASAVPPSPAAVPVERAPAAARPAFDWEQFMGAKLFAWLGGLAAFLAVGYFVKYSFEHDLIPPEVRVALGFVFSAGLVVAGMLIPRARYPILAQVLCAAGVVSLYAVTFACNAVYHFAFFGLWPTFLLMALITAAAFLLAVRMEAQVVALLGLLGGFLTPILLSTGRDNPAGLFGYVALLDAGLIAVALHRRWHHLVALAAGGTVLMQVGWASKFLESAKVPTAMIVGLVFGGLFFAAAELARRTRRSSTFADGSAAALALVALVASFVFVGFTPIAARPGLLFGYAFAADLLLLALAWRAEGAERLQMVAGGIVFALLGYWTFEHLTGSLLPWVLAANLLFAVLHSAFPLVLARLRPDADTSAWSQIYPPVTLLLLLLPLFKLDAVSLLYWPAVLAIGALAVLLALLSGSLLALGAVLVLTLTAAAVTILRTDPFVAEPLGLLVIVGGFALFFFAAGLFLARRFSGGWAFSNDGDGRAGLTHPAGRIPAASALLPFALLIMMSQRLSLTDPSPLFGLALLLVVLVLGLARLLALGWLPACGLAGLAALEYAWHFRHFDPSRASGPLLWYLGFHALFTVFPLVFWRRFVAQTGPWAVAALSGVAQFPLVYRLVQQAWPNEIPGVLPALFALPPLAMLIAILRRVPASEPARLNQLAWLGGTTLLFITLVFPIQFERQWITIAWALEGVALLWLFQRIPHPGLRGTGVALLVIVFVRLALNEAVFSYHPRSELPIFNWYLYTYGIALVCMFAGARLLGWRTPTATDAPAAGGHRVFGIPSVGLLTAFGTILAFLLLNIEIADYFSPAGTTLTFEFSGNFARDLAYTVGWALFALALLGAGIWQRARAARFAALGLLGATVLKLFFHDLAHLGQLYRVGALIAVAAVAILASFLYQRFVPGGEKSQTSQD